MIFVNATTRSDSVVITRGSDRQVVRRRLSFKTDFRNIGLLRSEYVNAARLDSDSGMIHRRAVGLTIRFARNLEIHWAIARCSFSDADRYRAV